MEQLRPTGYHYYVSIFSRGLAPFQETIKKVITVDADIGCSLQRTQYALVPSHAFSFASALKDSREIFNLDWDQLEPDPYMADGGSYRSRRYGLFRLAAKTGQLTHIPGASFFQSVETNLLNGGECRHFAALSLDTVENLFLRQLMQFDLAQFTQNQTIEVDWHIGVHQIRISAVLGVPGNPTPEGIHRDAEDFTSQHLISRSNINGGINLFYGSDPDPTEFPQATWEQEYYFDSYYFDHSLWHCVSPISSGACDGSGHRDVLLIDFINLSEVD